MSMKMPKPSDADRTRFQSLVPRDERVEVKPMFGNLGAFVNGNMFMGLFGADVGVKLAEADQADLRTAGGGSFGPAERPMAGYVTLPVSFDEPAARPWIAKSLAYISELPPKKPKKGR
jgi:TfoX/Sxy family transcriptional regulator of competence genes